MDATLILIFIILSAVTALFIISYFRKSPASGAEDAASDYAEGLNLLLEGDNEGALKKLRAAVKKDSTNVNAYLKIGDILRQRGEITRAINVHKYLTVRTGLSRKQRNDILFSLASDYKEAREYDKALSVAEQVLQDSPEEPWARSMKLQCLEHKEEWGQAYQTLREFDRKQHRNNFRLALYRVQEGLKLMEEEKNKEARARFKDAIKIAPECPPAYIHLADSYRSEERNQDALEVLKQFIEKNPKQSYLVFERLKELLYHGGVYSEIENVYLEIIEQQPDNLQAHLALVENYEKKGEVEKAIEVCSEILERDGTNQVARKYLVQLYHRTGDDHAAVNMALELINGSIEQKNNFRCRECNYESDEIFWRCPACLAWETAIRN
jgi:lipopolysaccharide biosynthesis regulator YciM